jgi:hypothetical protein
MTALPMPPLPGDPPKYAALEPDPRKFLRVPIARLVVDPRVQREQSRDRVQRLANEWDWLKAEVPTCAPLGNGEFRVIEGQTRVLALRERGYTGSVAIAVAEAPLTPSTEAGIALGIANGRKPHAAYDKWQLLVEQGSPHEVAAEAVLHARRLRLGRAPSARTIACVGEVTRIIHSDKRTADLGAELLTRVLATIDAAYDGTDTESYSQRFDRRIVRAVFEVFRRNPHCEPERLAANLRQRVAAAWISQTFAYPDPPWAAIGQRVVILYNKHLRDDDRRLSW